MKLFKNLVVIGLGAVGVVYLVNPGAGFLEFIPDVLPVVGNLDEAGATLLVISALRYFGMDPSRLFGRDKEQPDVIIQQPPQKH